MLEERVIGRRRVLARMSFVGVALAVAGMASSCVGSGDLLTQQLFADARSRGERRGIPTPTASPTAIPPTATSTSTRTPPPGRTFARVLRVWDGNTVLIEGGYSVRYIGVAAPGAGMFRRPVEPFGREAAERNIELVEGKEVQLEADEVDTDFSGNLLRYVYADGAMVNETLLREGLARLAPFGRNARHAPALNRAELEAHRAPLNIWTLATLTPTPTETPTITPTPTQTFTPSPSPIATATPRESPTPRGLPTIRGTATATARPGTTLVPGQVVRTATPAPLPLTVVPVSPQ